MVSYNDRSDLEDQINTARLRMLFDHVYWTLIASALLAIAVAWVIKDSANSEWLWPWLGVKLLCLVPRFIQTYQHRRHGHMQTEWRQTYWLSVGLIAVDGMVWGALGWLLTPLTQMETAAVTLATLVSVASVRAFVLAIDLTTMLAFVAPMLLPNVLYCLMRHDTLGLFASMSLTGFVVVNTLGSIQADRRIRELLRLRFDSERVAVERAKALEQARLHSDAKSRFLATVSHEMRTPLHGILGLTRVLQQEHPRPEQRQRLTLIERSGEHLLTVINDVLDFSKIEAGRMDLDAHPFDLTGVLNEAAGVFQVLAQRKGINLHLHMSWAGPREVVGDANRLRQILHNLLGNAVKFTDRGSVHLSADQVPGGHFYELSVRDTGLGIAARDIEAIFEAFSQGHGLAEKRAGGTGLGLSIARQMCRAMGGDLVCDSAPGLGSNFKARLLLPQAPANGLGATPNSSQDHPDTQAPDSGWWSAAGAHVLLVEDNQVNILLAEAVLNNLGCHVDTVTDGLQAVEWLEAQQCDVVLMDCAMPVMNGFEATREIRRREQFEKRSRVPIVALTANVMADERGQCLQAGMDDYLAKPFSPDDIQRVIMRVISNASILRSL